MSRLRRLMQASASVCAAVFLFSSVATAQDPAEEGWPKVELSAGTWISVGDTKWAHNASSIPGLGDPTSKLIYKDVGTNFVDLAGKFWLTPKIFGKLNVGFANIGGGRLTDNDYLAVDGGSPSSQTYRNLGGNNTWSLNADIGARALEFRNHRGWIDVFGGFQYWYQRLTAYGVGQNGCTTAGATEGLCPSSIANSVLVITNTTNWYSLRLGASSEYRLTRRLSVQGTVALIPASALDNKDVHHLRPDLQQNPSFSMTGYGIGADLDIGARFMIMKNFAANVGYRLYYNRLISGDLTNHPASGPSSSFPLTQFESLRHGLTAGLTLIF